MCLGATHGKMNSMEEDQHKKNSNHKCNQYRHKSKCDKCHGSSHSSICYLTIIQMLYPNVILYCYNRNEHCNAVAQQKNRECGFLDQTHDAYIWSGIGVNLCACETHKKCQSCCNCCTHHHSLLPDLEASRASCSLDLL